MMTTGSPEASLLATCGSDPTDLAPPFGGRHGTRLKMSPADFATSFTLSIALAVRLFCCAGFARSTAAILPAPVGAVACGAGGLGLSDLALSDLAPSDRVACCAAWTAWARAGDIDAAVGSTNAATAGRASNATRQKGR